MNSIQEQLRAMATNLSGYPPTWKPLETLLFTAADELDWKDSVIGRYENLLNRKIHYLDIPNDMSVSEIQSLLSSAREEIRSKAAADKMAHAIGDSFNDLET